MESLTLQDLLCPKEKSEAEKLYEFKQNQSLSKDELLLRKYGLKDENGEYTRIAEDIITEKVMDDNKSFLLGLIVDKVLAEKEEEKLSPIKK